VEELYYTTWAGTKVTININAEPLLHLRNMCASLPTQTTSSVKLVSFTK